jgi:hypothetical protein
MTHRRSCRTAERATEREVGVAAVPAEQAIDSRPLP